MYKESGLALLKLELETKVLFASSVISVVCFKSMGNFDKFLLVVSN